MGMGSNLLTTLRIAEAIYFWYDCFLMRNQDVRIGQLRYMSLLSAIPTE